MESRSVTPRNAEQSKTSAAFRRFLSIIKPEKRYVLVYIIILINISLFVLMLLTGVNPLSPGVEELIRWGGNFGPQTLGGEWWRLLSSIFIHGGLDHLAANIYAFLYLGPLIEPVSGKLIFLLSYLLSGIAGSMTSLWVDSFKVSVGASGAIFGMYGFFLILLLSGRRPASGAFGRQSVLSTVIFLANSLIRGFDTPGIDNAAHVGGLVYGALVGIMFLPSIWRPAALSLRTVNATLVTALSFFSAIYFYQIIPKDVVKFADKMNMVAQNEKTANSTLQTLFQNPPPNKGPYYFINELERNGVKIWVENLDILQELKHLPPRQKRTVDLLLEYCQYRKRQCELFINSIRENSVQYNAELSELKGKIEKINAQLKDLRTQGSPHSERK